MTGSGDLIYFSLNFYKYILIFHCRFWIFNVALSCIPRICKLYLNLNIILHNTCSVNYAGNFFETMNAAGNKGEQTNAWRILCNTLINGSFRRSFRMGTNYYDDFSQVSLFHTLFFLLSWGRLFEHTYIFKKYIYIGDRYWSIQFLK